LLFLSIKLGYLCGKEQIFKAKTCHIRQRDITSIVMSVNCQTPLPHISTKRELQQTLRVLYDTDLDINTAAYNMSLHFNTLKYRIKEIEELADTQVGSHSGQDSTSS